MGRWTQTKELTIFPILFCIVIVGCATTIQQKPLSPSEKIDRLVQNYEKTKDIKPLIDALGDTDHMVRMAAARILGETRNPLAVDPLVLTLRTDKHYAVREEAAYALGQIKDRSAVEALVEALGDADSGVQRIAAASLGEIKDQRAIEPLVFTLKEQRDPLVRSAVLAALDKIGWKISSEEIAVMQKGPISKAAVPMEKLPRIWLFAVGISKYQYENIDLAYAAKDAQELYSFMVSRKGEDITNEQAVLLLNNNATRANIIGEFTRLMMRTMPEDLVIVYMAMHGLPDPTINELHFVAYDTDLNNLLATGVSQTDLARVLSYGRAKKILIVLDSCHSGQLGASMLMAKRSIYVTSVNRLFNQLTKVSDGVAILSASSAAELSEEGQLYGGGHGAFTYYLLEALRGEADRNKDDIVTLREVYDYVYRNVAKSTKGRQHPELKGIFDNELPLVEIQ